MKRKGYSVGIHLKERPPGQRTAFMILILLSQGNRQEMMSHIPSCLHTNNIKGHVILEYSASDFKCLCATFEVKFMAFPSVCGADESSPR